MRLLAELLWGEDDYKLPSAMPPNITLDGTLYKIFPKGSEPQTFRYPPGKVVTGDGMLHIMVWDADVTPPVFSSPPTTTIITHKTMAFYSGSQTLGTTGVGSGNGSAMSLVMSTSNSSQPNVTWNTAKNQQVGLLYSIPLPARFATATRQLVSIVGSAGGVLPANALTSTFTTTFSGYYFVIQSMDVSSSSNVPGSVAPGTDLTYGIGLNTSTGTWTSPGSFIIPNNIQKNGGVVFRIDFAYLAAGTTVTVGNTPLSNTRATAGQYLAVLGFNVTQ